MYHLARAAGICVILVTFSASILQAQDTLKVLADGSQVVPSVSTNGSGIFTVIKTDDSLAVKGSFKDLLGYYTGGYIHMAKRGENGNMLFKLSATDLNKDHTAGKFKLEDNTFHLSDALEQYYNRNMLYINIATNVNRSGEIRGQIEPN